MGRHKTKEEWLFWFKKYESGNFKWGDYFDTLSKSWSPQHHENSKKHFRRKYRAYMTGNHNIIVSMTGKKATGRPPKEKQEIDWDIFSREDLIEIAKRYKEITKDKTKKEKDAEVASLNLTKAKIAILLSISRSGLYYIKKEETKLNMEVAQIIIEAFHKYHKRFGRDRIAAITGINYRRVGRYMHTLGLKCTTRVAKMKRESKNTCVKFKDLVNREYNKKNVIATDVSYIPTNNGFAYLSIAINHFTKKIESWNFSRTNDVHLVLKHMRKINLSGMILHSDHGTQYSSYDYIQLSKKMGFSISMSRVGNSLDNREAEYFFSNIKSEVLNNLNLHKYSFERVHGVISEYIRWYNNERPQSILHWKTPEQFAQMSI